MIHSDDFIGLTSLFGDDIYYFSASALKETRICSIDREGIKDLVTQCCDFSRELSNWYCTNYNIMLTKCLNTVPKDIGGCGHFFDGYIRVMAYIYLYNLDPITPARPVGHLSS